MKKLLLTGFGPFDQHSINFSQDVVLELNNSNIAQFNVTSKILPVSFSKIPEMIISLIESETPDVILSLGIASDRTKITPELCAVNKIHSEFCDNDGVIIKDSIINANGEDIYHSNLSIHNIVEKLKNQNFPCETSSDAGTFVCNLVLYSSLHYIQQNNLKINAGFIHLPTCLQPNILVHTVKKFIECI